MNQDAAMFPQRSQPYNLTIVWITVHFEQLSELYYKTEDGFVGGKYSPGHVALII